MEVNVVFLVTLTRGVSRELCALSALAAWRAHNQLHLHLHAAVDTSLAAGRAEKEATKQLVVWTLSAP